MVNMFFSTFLARNSFGPFVRIVPRLLRISRCTKIIENNRAHLRYETISTFRFCHSASFTSRLLDTKPPKTTMTAQIYLDQLIAHNMVRDDDRTQIAEKLLQQIEFILDQYRYELYCRSLESFGDEDVDEDDDENGIPREESSSSSSSSSYFDLDDAYFDLQPHELNDMLRAGDDERERLKIIRYFASNKLISRIAAYRKNRQREIRISAAAAAAERDPRQATSGLWSHDGDLVYGLWHNALFLRMYRGTLSRLFDRRALSASCIHDRQNGRLLLDLDHVHRMAYFDLRRCGTQLRQLFAFNKFKSRRPFSIEFFESDDPTATTTNNTAMQKKIMKAQCNGSHFSHFNDMMRRYVPDWNNPSRFLYQRHRGIRTFADLIPDDHDHHQPQTQAISIYYILPIAREPLTEREILEPNSLFILPAFVTTNSRDLAFHEIQRHVLSRNSARAIDDRRFVLHFRRIPTTEHVSWNKHNGVLPLNIIFAILHDARYDSRFDWRTIFYRYLAGASIKSREEIERIAKSRHERYKRRVVSIEKFFRHHDGPIRSPESNRIETKIEN